MRQFAPGERMRQFGTADRVQLATRIPKALHRAVKLAALNAEVPLGTLVAEALTEHLARCRGARRPRLVRDADRNAPRSRGSGAASGATGEE